MTEITPNHAWTGSRYIDVLNPQPWEIEIEEVATGLSRECRYGGSATAIFWSVAQHCLLCDSMARQDGVTDKRLLRTILMHDAPEYMLRDIIRPVKRNVPSYHVIEEAWWRAVAIRFNLSKQLDAIVKYYDNEACAVEKRFLIDPSAGAWPGINPQVDYTIPPHLISMTMQQVAENFAQRLRDLS